MSGFSAEWLSLREPADAAARAGAVAAFVLDTLPVAEPVRVVDLGCGTGSNLRYLESRIDRAQTWRLVDHDAGLLEAARARLPFVVETRVADLRQLDDTLFADRDLVTASALLDLVSEPWLSAFVRHCQRAGAAVLVVLNYDGRLACSPQDEDDELVQTLVNAHQRTDKGFGPALGPDAGVCVERLLRAAGYQVIRAASDWSLDAGQPELQRQLIVGWAGAAVECAPAEATRIRAWEARRLAHVDAGHSTLIVGHDDVGAVLAPP